MRPFILITLLLLPLGLMAADGHALYQHNCAVCHGVDGQGGVGVPLALSAFLAQSSDEYLALTIRHGRPGRIMPTFNHLADDDIKSIIKYIRSWQPDIKPPVYDNTPVMGDIDKGRLVFDQHCSNCHGLDAIGGKGTGVMFSRPHDLPIMPPALNNSGFLAAASDAMIHHIIEQGRASTPMPAAKTLGVSAQQIDDIVSYLRNLQPRQMIDPSDEPSVLVAESSYSYEETIEKVKAAAVGMNFRLIRDQPLDSGLVKEGNETKHQMMVYFCNFNFLYKALAIDPRVGLFLPCRVTVIETADGKVKVMSINPKRLSHLFNNNELDQACDEMYKLYQSILDEATL